MMSTRCLSAATAVLLAIVATSCARSGPGYYPVHGKVIYKGKPAAGASVHFHREGATQEEDASYPMGVVDEDGNFTLAAEGAGSGALPGKYKVLVRWSPEKAQSAPAATPAPAGTKKSRRGPVESVAEQRRDPKSDSDRLNFRYFHLDKPLLFAEIKPETNNLPPFDLEDGPTPAEEKKPRRSTVTEDRG
jgi:hypothetical protein